jgi:hypothetical protein
MITDKASLARAGLSADAPHLCLSVTFSIGVQGWFDKPLGLAKRLNYEEGCD